MSFSKPIKLFVSSTCYDLMDARAELRSYLEPLCFEVILSDDFESEFKPTHNADSIQSCLDNVATCDAVVCLVVE
jgi:hypothetical protein